MPAWKKANKPLFSRAKSLKKMMDTETPVVLVDLRSGKEAQKAHIKGAVSIPADQLASFKDKFPSIKSAPVVLYGDDTSAGLEHFATVRGWGFKNTTVLRGGFAGWNAAGLPNESGATPDEIVYVPKPKPGVIATELFADAIEGKAQDVVILDVRTDEETEAGKIAGALAIPAEEVFERLDEIPKDKKVYVHCSTGIRAEMAYLTLKEKGYTANFLDANIAVEKDGKYQITAKE